jgi:hypothetical protein
MRNFEEHTVFSKSLEIVAPEPNWLVDVDTDILTHQAKTNLQVSLRLRKADGQPVGLRELELKVVSGTRSHQKVAVETAADGTLRTAFSLPEDIDLKDAGIIISDLRKGEGNRTMIVPLNLGGSLGADVQFFPEGGRLVAGISAQVAFKAIGNDGRAINVEGRILNAKQQQVQTFKSQYKGMGSFSLTPEPGERYVAEIRLSETLKKTYFLPTVEAEGTSLSVSNTPEKNELEVCVKASRAISLQKASFYLIGQSRGVVCYAKPLVFNEAQVVIPIPKNIFPTGIARFTLLTGDWNPLNERIVFLNQKDDITIDIAGQDSVSASRDSITLMLKASDKDGRPVQGSFSVSVTDDGQVSIPVDQTLMSTYLHLQSDLKGEIEAPAHYFSEQPEASIHLDNLMLSQGWVGYDWKNVFAPSKPLYEPEYEFTISGKVTGLVGGLANTKVNLVSQKPLTLMDTLTDDRGRFIFKRLPLSDSSYYKVQALNRNDKSRRIGIQVDEWTPPTWRTRPMSYGPWYVNADANLSRTVNTANILRLNQSPSGKNILNEVTIKAKKVVKGSRNLNGSGEADHVLDEEDLKNAGKTLLLDVLSKQVKGFGLGGWEPMVNRMSTYLLNGKRVKFMIDGIDADRVYHFFDPVDGAADGEGPNDHLLFIRDLLGNFTAEDLLGIEVMHSPKFNTTYHPAVLSYKESSRVTQTGRSMDYAYIEITTRNGRGPFINKTPGVYFYKPIPFALPKQFYRPKYRVKHAEGMPDIRSTIHWEPNIVTGADGKAVLSFYSADKPTTYTIIVEGTDMDGKVGGLIKRKFIRVMADK